MNTDRSTASSPKQALADFLARLTATGGEGNRIPAADSALVENWPAAALVHLRSQHARQFPLSDPSPSGTDLCFSPGAGSASDVRGESGAPLKLGLAVSGGGDSVALLRLMADLARGAGSARIKLFVYTVDHQLRPEAAAEAAWVAALAKELGADHRSLAWLWDGRGNIAEAARHGRYRALAKACQADGVSHCLLGHTRDDNIETLFLGLLRGAGLDGLAGMRPSFLQGGVRFHRPWLGVARDDLRAALRELGQSWHEDPTNSDLTHERARVRHMLSTLDLPAERLAQSLSALAATRRDLGIEVLARLSGAVHAEGPVLVIDAKALMPLTPELRRRAFAAALKVVGRAQHAPRAAQLARLVARDWRAEPAPVTLGGCRIWFAREALRLTREFAAVPRPVPCGDVWDGWRLIGASHADLRVRDLRYSDLRLGALGQAGRAQIGPEWRAARIPAAAILATPALWQGEVVLASAFAQPKCAETGPVWQFQGPDLPASFTRAVMAH